MTVHRKGYEYKEVATDEWRTQQSDLVPQGWELVSVDQGRAYLKRYWNEGKWDGEPPECGMW